MFDKVLNTFLPWLFLFFTPYITAVKICSKSTITALDLFSNVFKVYNSTTSFDLFNIAFKVCNRTTSFDNVLMPLLLTCNIRSLMNLNFIPIQPKTHFFYQRLWSCILFLTCHLDYYLGIKIVFWVEKTFSTAGKIKAIPIKRISLSSLYNTLISEYN